MSAYRLVDCVHLPRNERCWRFAAGADLPDYRVQAALPRGDRPDGGWPALVLVDGEGVFGTFAEAVARLSRRGDATGVAPAVIVAVTAIPVPGVDHRKRDLATSATEVAGQVAGGAGGADRFLDLLTSELMPGLLPELGLDPDRLSLLGHSLAGYFALYALGASLSPFSQFVALSPSIWWDEAGLRHRLSQIAGTGRRAFLAVGEWEGALPPWQAGHPQAQAALTRRRERQMIANTQRLASQLAGELGEQAVRMRLFDDEDHASILTRSVAPVLRFLSEDWRR